MKIAISSTGASIKALVSEKFGRCEYFIICNTANNSYEAIPNSCKQMQGGAGPKAVELISKAGADILLTGRLGDKAAEALKQTNIRLVDGISEQTIVENAVENFFCALENFN